MFTTDFNSYACEGDAITCVVDGFKVTAHIERDDSGDTPEDRDEGFWPSRDRKACGYVGGGKRAFDAAMAKAVAVMNAWRNDEWFYCGVCVVVERNGVELTHRYDNALWGVECNYPDTNNSYLRQVANELLGEALDTARAKLATLCACEPA